MAIKTKEKKETIKIDTPSGKYFYATGKRKCSVAKVRIYKGAGVITINNKPIKDFCDRKTDIGLVKSPLKLTGTDKNFDITIKVDGGGISSQVQAARHGIARGLLEAEPLSKITLKKAGMLTRDARVKERKKFGLKKARKGPQFSKR